MNKKEEQKIIAQMQEAMEEKKKAEEASARAHEERLNERKRWYDSKVPETLHCRRCKSVMKDGVCPTCGFKMYVPMDKQKQQKIRLIAGGICLIIFAVLFVLSQAR